MTWMVYEPKSYTHFGTLYKLLAIVGLPCEENEFLEDTEFKELQYIQEALNAKQNGTRCDQ